MKNILLFLMLSAGFVFGQVSDKVRSDLTTHGNGGNSTQWVAEIIFADSGAQRIGPFSVDQSPAAIGIARHAVWDSQTTTPADDYHWDSSWTASDFGLLYGFQRKIPADSTGATTRTTDSLDFLPVFDYDDAANRMRFEADSMAITVLPPTMAYGAKYMYIEFLNPASNALVAQGEPRTFVIFYRKY